MKLRKQTNGAQSLAWRRRLIHRCFILAGAVFGVLPRRMVFLFLLAADLAKLPGHRRLATAYQPYVAFFLTGHPGGSFAGPLASYFPVQSARVLFWIGAYREACKVISGEGLSIYSREMTELLARAIRAWGVQNGAGGRVGEGIRRAASAGAGARVAQEHARHHRRR